MQTGVYTAPSVLPSSAPYNADPPDTPNCAGAAPRSFGPAPSDEPLLASRARARANIAENNPRSTISARGNNRYAKTLLRQCSRVSGGLL